MGGPSCLFGVLLSFLGYIWVLPDSSHYLEKRALRLCRHQPYGAYPLLFLACGEEKQDDRVLDTTTGDDSIEDHILSRIPTHSDSDWTMRPLRRLVRLLRPHPSPL